MSYAQPYVQQTCYLCNATVRRSRIIANVWISSSERLENLPYEPCMCESALRKYEELLRGCFTALQVTTWLMGSKISHHQTKYKTVACNSSLVWWPKSHLPSGNYITKHQRLYAQYLTKHRQRTIAIQVNTRTQDLALRNNPYYIRATRA